MHSGITTGNKVDNLELGNTSTFSGEVINLLIPRKESRQPGRTELTKHTADKEGEGRCRKRKCELYRLFGFMEVGNPKKK